LESGTEKPKPNGGGEQCQQEREDEVIQERKKKGELGIRN